MTGTLPSRAWWLVIALAVLAVAGLGLLATRSTAPAGLPVAEIRACDSCNARHAGLADLRARQMAGTE